MAFRVDVSAAPVVLVVWSAPPNAEQAHAFFDEMDRIHDDAHARGDKVVCIHDVNYASAPGADVRKILGERAKSLSSKPAALFQIATLHSAAQRGVVTVVSWFAPSIAGRLKVVATVAEGWKVAQDVLAKNNIAAPPAPSWLASSASSSSSSKRA